MVKWVTLISKCCKEYTVLAISRNVSECIIAENFVLKRKRIVKVIEQEVKLGIGFSLYVHDINDCEEVLSLNM